jgi:hypothetical protein
MLGRTSGKGRPITQFCVFTCAASGADGMPITFWRTLVKEAIKNENDAERNWRMWAILGAFYVRKRQPDSEANPKKL